MGVGAIFLAMEARAQLETGTSTPLDELPVDLDPVRLAQIDTVWVVVQFIVLGSTIIHGLSVAAISVIGHFRRGDGERASEFAGETEPLHGMVHEDSEGEETQSESEDDGDNERRGGSGRGRIALLG